MSTGGAFKTTPTAGAMTTLRGIRRVMMCSLITSGSTTELSATDAWHRAVVDDAPDISIITQDCQSATVQTGQIHYLDTLNFKSGPRYWLASKPGASAYAGTAARAPCVPAARRPPCPLRSMATS